jgi:hypothetical protein
VETLNSVKRLLQFLEGYGPGQWVIITNELGKIFEAPEFRFKYSGYAEQIRAFLSGMEDEGLIQLNIGDQDLYDAALGDLNSVYCDLEKHDIRAKLTKEGLVYIGRLSRPVSHMFYLGQHVQFNYQSPGANNVKAGTSISEQFLPDKKRSVAEKLKQFAKTIKGVRAIWIAALSFSGSLSIVFGLWKTDNLPTISFSVHRANDRLIWPSNLRYIDLDTVTGLTSSDRIVIAWVKGHLEDSAIAQRLYIDLKNAGYNPQLVQELAFADQMKFKGCQFTLQLQLLHDYSRRIQVIINPDFNFFKE